MNTADTTLIVDAVARLLGVLIWPAILLFFLLRFGRQLQQLLENVGELTLAVSGVEISLKRMQTEATAALTAAELARTGETEAAAAVVAGTQQAAKLVTSTLTARTARQLQDAHLLWVDDRPEHNRYERQLLSALGINITLAESTKVTLQNSVE